MLYTPRKVASSGLHGTDGQTLGVTLNLCIKKGRVSGNNWTFFSRFAGNPRNLEKNAVGPLLSSGILFNEVATLVHLIESSTPIHTTDHDLDHRDPFHRYVKVLHKI